MDLHWWKLPVHAPAPPVLLRRLLLPQQPLLDPSNLRVNSLEGVRCSPAPLKSKFSSIAFELTVALDRMGRVDNLLGTFGNWTFHRLIFGSLFLFYFLFGSFRSADTGHICMTTYFQSRCHSIIYFIEANLFQEQIWFFSGASWDRDHRSSIGFPAASQYLVLNADCRLCIKL